MESKKGDYLKTSSTETGELGGWKVAEALALRRGVGTECIWYSGWWKKQGINE